MNATLNPEGSTNSRR